MGFAVTTDLPPEQAELDDLYEIVDGKKVWPRGRTGDGRAV